MLKWPKLLTTLSEPKAQEGFQEDGKSAKEFLKKIENLKSSIFLQPCKVVLLGGINMLQEEWLEPKVAVTTDSWCD